ncbi:MAG: hypothetical protein IT377_26820 [Polyangiaceae bacterium]|nr:hypothetical protein [Polyangiaceae bacterium]
MSKTPWGWVIASALSLACSSAGSGGGGTGGSGASAGAGASGGSAGSGAAAGSGGNVGGSAGVAGSAGTGGTAGSGATGGSATGGGGGSGGSGGAEACGNGVDDDQDGYKDCDDDDCFDDAGCVTKEAAELKAGDHTPCGKPVTFADTLSVQTCQGYSMGFQKTKCAFGKFSGTITFLCGPKPAAGQKDSVLVRWKVHASIPQEKVGSMPVLYEPIGGEYAWQSGGGSSINPRHYTFDLVANQLEADLVGYEKLTVPAGASAGDLREWFTLNSFSPPAVFIGGGFTVTIDMNALRAGK